MELDKVKELEVVRSTDDDPSIDQAEQSKSKEEKEPEQKGLVFYHTDLYDSHSGLEIFPENEEQVQEETYEHKDVNNSGAEQTQENLQKEVEELAKMYGLSEDKDAEEFPSFTEPYHQMPTRPNVPHPVQTSQHPKQNTENNQSKHEGDIKPKVLEDVPHTDKQTTKEDVGEEVEISLDGEIKDKKQLHQEHVNPESSDDSSGHVDVKQEIPGQLPVDGCADARTNVNQADGTEASCIESSNQVNEDREEAPDIFCLVCQTPIRAFEKLFGIHKDHDVKEIRAAVEEIKEEIHKNMCKLEEQITQMENFAGHLEEMYTTIEENSGRQDQNLELHCTEVIDTIASKLEDKMQALGEEKRLKLESLFEQLVDCGKSLDTSKDLMETIQQLFKQNDKVEFVKAALHTTNRLHQYFNTDINLNISTNADFKSITLDYSDVDQLLDSINSLPVPSPPVINPQTPNSATATSLRVCWSLFSDDTVEHYHLYYKPVSDVTPGGNREEFMIRAKETYCTVSNLLPNTQYEFWVIGINATGESPASESAVYVTAPAPPNIKTRECLSCQNAALICWESGNINPVESYTVEILKVATEAQDNLVTESIVGIPICECLIQLKPNETYRISVRAVNVGGPSESSKSVSIHTTGSFFYLNEETAHPLLSISDNGFTISCEEEESLEDLPYHCNKFSRCIAVLANLIPFKGRHYWEVEVDEHAEYRIGVAYEDINRSAVLGANNSSWCLRHVRTPARHRYEFLHCGVSPDIRVSIPLLRIGILLDYDCERLSFFNMDILQHFYTFECQFRHLVHPCFALEKPGRLKIHNGIPIPQSLNLS
ncbi:fibronectin type III and SPRY domain-containing protein 2 isoform X1 [Ranitomeya variabilis]|uniref:fibronectin type III and SPRY domain-containing protein 2 isoform X1 n=1 Tax=Ranitomeya variabilis TaxID=490064 RepID=UPI0040578B18